MTWICKLRRRCRCGVCAVMRELVEIELDDIRRAIAGKTNHREGFYR